MQQWQATSRKFEGRHRRALIMKLSFWFIHNRTASKEFSVSKLVTSFLHYSHSWMMTCDHSSVCARCLIDRQILLLALGEAHVVRSEESTWEPAPSKTEFYFHTLPSHSGQQRFTRQCLGWVFCFLLFFFLLFVGGWSNRIRNWEEWMTWLKEADSHFKGFPPRTPQLQKTRWVF